jgi:3-oxoacyl-[acyl-carrier protein] reductase
MSIDASLAGRVAVVTGAGSGIGTATAVRLAAAGAYVACLDIDGAAAATTAEEIGAVHADSSGAFTVDVSDPAAIGDAVAEVRATRGRLDVMVNVAGIIRNGSVIDTAEADLDAVLAVNFKGVFFGCQAAARLMVEQRSGSIVNMASAAIDDPSPGLVCYATAKAAVAQLTRTLAAEIGPSGVRVNAVAPGFIETPMTARHFTQADGTLDEDRRAAVHAPMIARSPLGMIGQPDDVAEAVAYLASDASRFVTGQVLRVNGGVAMPL